MAELFTVRLDLGPTAPISTVATALTDLQVVTDQALQLAARHAENEARSYLSSLVQQNPQALLDLARRHELSGGEDFESGLRYLEEWLVTLDELRFLPPSRKFPERFLLFGLSGQSGVGLQPPWLSAIEQLVALETADRLPRHGCRVQSLTYANPVTTEIIAASGATAAALALLLRTIATLPSYVRRHRARARDIEDQVSRRMELRALLMRWIVRGEIQLRPEDISAALLDDLVGTADRLADQGLNFEQLHIDFAFPGSGVFGDSGGS